MSKGKLSPAQLDRLPEIEQAILRARWSTVRSPRRTHVAKAKRAAKARRNFRARRPK